MNRLSRALIFPLCTLLLTAAAAAENWQTAAPSVMYDAPSGEARPLFILSGGYPLKQISEVYGWYKLSGYNGEIGWITADKLRPMRGAVIISDNAAIRVDPHPAAAALFFARRGVILEVLSIDRATGWLKIAHQDGEAGYLQISDSWLNF